MSKKIIKKDKYMKKEKEKKQKMNVKYIIITVVILFFLGLFLINTNQGKILISSLFENKSTFKELPISPDKETRVSSNKETPISPDTKSEIIKPESIDEKDNSNQVIQKEPVKTQPDEKTIIDPKTIKIAVSDLNNQFQYFSFTSKKNVRINYFALLDNNGNPHIAFDACDVCYRAKKGYAQQGDLALCRNCGRSFPVKAIGTENKQGGCWPSYLPITIKGNEVIIDAQDLERKEYMFS